MLGRAVAAVDAVGPGGADEGARRLQPAVEPERADQGFDGVAQDVVALERAVGERLLAEPHMRGDADLAADLGADAARDEHVQPPRQFALGLVRKEAVEPVGDGDAEHPVAEEFEPLIIVLAEARMGQRPFEQAEIGRAVAEPGLEPVRERLHQ